MIELHGIHHQWRDKVPQAIHDQLIVFGFRYQWEILICSLSSAALHRAREVAQDHTIEPNHPECIPSATFLRSIH